MIQVQLKLKPSKTQALQLDEWLPMLAAVWNWGIRKIELDARGGIYYSVKSFQNLLANHGQKIGIPSHTLQGVLIAAHDAWQRCFRKQCRKPRLKGARNKLNHVPFPDPVRIHHNNRVAIPGVGRMRFFKRALPSGKIKSGRIVKRASGWYLCLFIDAEPNAVQETGNGRVGIDPGFNSLIALSTGEKVNHPREVAAAAARLAQAQRGGNRKLVARIRERTASRRRDRNHKLSRRLVSENQFIAFSADPHKRIARRFGKSVGDSAHLQLRRMLSYKSKCRTDGLGVYVEVESRNSTKTCSACRAPTGPTGLAGLKVRQWTCVACGAER